MIKTKRATQYCKLIGPNTSKYKANSKSKKNQLEIRKLKPKQPPTNQNETKTIK